MQCVAHLDKMLGQYGEADVAGISGQPVEDWKYRTSCRVLDGHDKPVNAPAFKCAESCSESGIPTQLSVREQFRRGLMAVAMGLALVSDDHGERRYRLNDPLRQSRAVPRDP